MNSSACSRGMPSRCDSPNAVSPYSTPKLNTFARRRISASTASGSTPNTRAAVARWMSAPPRNAARSSSSPETCARIRSSICE